MSFELGDFKIASFETWSQRTHHLSRACHRAADTAKRPIHFAQCLKRFSVIKAATAHGPFYPFQLLSKMAPLVGRAISESLFLERFAALCSDPLFHVRKVCAANFGDFSSVVGSEATEQVLVCLMSFIFKRFRNGKQL